MLSFYSPATRPVDEAARQAAVDASGLRDVPLLQPLQEIVAHAARAFDAPMSAVSIVDRDRQWFAARVGLRAPETSRAVSFCAHAILTPGEPFVVRDAQADQRFAGNPLVVGDPYIRFYAGMPLLGVDGQPLGTLCVIDRKVHDVPLPLEKLAILSERASAIIVEVQRSLMLAEPARL